MQMRRQIFRSTMLFTSIFLLLMAFNITSLSVLSSIRALVAGESTWSKAQRAGTRGLHRFALSGDIEDYNSFRASIEHLDTFKSARLELLRRDPDFERARHLLSQGEVHPTDAIGITLVLHYGKSVRNIERALDLWAQGDERIQMLKTIATVLIEGSERLSVERVVDKSKVLEEIERIDLELIVLERQFSATLTETARSAESAILHFNLLAAIVLLVAALSISYRMHRRLRLSLDSFIDGTRKIRDGDLSARMESSDFSELKFLSEAVNSILDTNSRLGEREVEREEFEAQIFALNQTAIISIADEDGIIEMVNERFCEIAGYSREELVGQNHRIINSGFHPKYFFAEMWRIIASGNRWSGEVCNRKKDGSIYWVDCTITPIKGKDGRRRFLSIRYDITHRKELEQKVIQSSKMTALGEMASGVAHEINNPLAIIAGKCSLLIRGAKSGTVDVPSLVTELEKIKKNAARIEGIVKGLRLFTRDEKADPCESVNLKSIVEDTLELCGERLKASGVKLYADLDHNCMVDCRPTQISQVLLNLLMNSFDAVEQLNEKWIRVETKKDERGMPIITVTDSGAGIPEGISQKIMDPFFTTKEVGKGTGLGLSISYGIIKEHSGEIYLDPSSKNTRFVVRLPQTSLLREVA